MTNKSKELETKEMAEAVTMMRLIELYKKYPKAAKKLGYPTYVEETAETEKDWDAVVLDKPINEVVKDLGERLKMNAVEMTKVTRPFLERGVIRFPRRSDNDIYHVFWQANGQTTYIEAYEQRYSGELMLDLVGELHESPIKLDAIRYENKAKIILDAYNANKINLTKPELELTQRLVDYSHELADWIAVCFSGLMMEINAILASEESTASETVKPYSTVLRANKKKDLPRRIVYLDRVTVMPGRDSNLKIHKGAIMNRHTDVWGVRGHERHYKSGKVVWINPYEKGPERGKKKPAAKEYRLHGGKA